LTHLGEQYNSIRQTL